MGRWEEVGWGSAGGEMEAGHLGRAQRVGQTELVEGLMAGTEAAKAWMVVKMVWVGGQEAMEKEPEQGKKAVAAGTEVAALEEAPLAKVGAAVTAALGSPNRYLDAPSQSSTRGRSARLGPPMSVQPAAP